MMWNLKLAAAVGILFTTSLAGTAWYAYNSGKQSGMSQIQTRWDAERLALTQAQAEELMKARQREEALKALLVRQRKEYKRETDRIAADRDRLLASLRDRPERPASGADVPDGAASGAGCTGAELARPDAEFLVGYAADAERLQSALRACQRAYDEVRESINGGD